MKDNEEDNAKVLLLLFVQHLSAPAYGEVRNVCVLVLTKKEVKVERPQQLVCECIKEEELEHRVLPLSLLVHSSL